MAKQNNYVAKHNFNKGGFHKDKSKVIPREEKYDDMDKMLLEAIENIEAMSKEEFRDMCEEFGHSPQDIQSIEFLCMRCMEYGNYILGDGVRYCKKHLDEVMDERHSEYFNDVQGEEKI